MTVTTSSPKSTRRKRQSFQSKHIKERTGQKCRIASGQIRFARALWGKLETIALHELRNLLEIHNFSISGGDLIFLENRWYVTYKGLLGLATRNYCAGIDVRPMPTFCSPERSKWAFRATVYKTAECRGFVGYGDADPSNVSPLVHGAEMRVAETRAVNRALRKAYGIGICSIEELSSNAEPHFSSLGSKKPAQPANGNYTAPKIRDRLCQIIRQYQLDPTLVKAYAVDFCRTKTLREANREQVENFVSHLADWAEKDRDSLVGRLNGYLAAKEGAA